MMITLCGFMCRSVIEGFIVDAIRETMDTFKQGKAKVAEEEHTVRALVEALVL